MHRFLHLLLYSSPQMILIVEMFLSQAAHTESVCVLWQGKDMLMVLKNDTMNLIDPLGQTLLHAQPIGSIRVWGVGRDNGRSVSTVQDQNEDGRTTHDLYSLTSYICFKQPLLHKGFVWSRDAPIDRLVDFFFFFSSHARNLPVSLTYADFMPVIFTRAPHD